MAGLQVASSDWRTSLETRALADLFRSTAEAAVPTSLFGRLTTNHNTWMTKSGTLQNVPRFADLENALSYFTPTSGDSPFAQFEREPDFSCGASIPHKSGLPMVIHMHVTKEGTGCLVELSSPYIAKFGYTRPAQRKANACLLRFETAIKDADPGASRVL